MLNDNGELPRGIKAPTIFAKKPLLNISALVSTSRSVKHIQKDKLSDKMGRRDIIFYDLYKLKEPPEAVAKLQENGFNFHGILDIPAEEEEVYGDIEADDFNELFINDHIIEEQFGKSITVKLTLN